ncbi:DNA-directed RNA polymerase III subunit Rpc5 [Trichophyton rubrum]|nr:DNA-directed RNA polymerase III subunit Rpc5 [Trichophyton rubrum]
MPPADAQEDDDPITASYDIFITDSQIRRLLLQYPDRPADQPYNDSIGQKPLEFRLKPKTGLVELDIPIDTQVNYDEVKGLRYGNALAKSRITQENGSHGMAGGFNVNGGGIGKFKTEGTGADDVNVYMDMDDEDRKAGVKMTTQVLGGRIKKPVDGDPVYMLGAFRDNELHLAPLEAVVQLRPQLHHIDAYDEVSVKSKAMAKAKKDMDEDSTSRNAAMEARAIDMKVKSADTEGARAVGNNELLLKLFQDEKWEKYRWIDENDQESWDKYDQYMFNEGLEEPVQLQSAITADDYLDSMSAPRVDPTRPEMTGWAMKRRQQIRRASSSHKKGKPQAENDGDDDGDITMA